VRVRPAQLDRIRMAIVLLLEWRR